MGANPSQLLTEAEACEAIKLAPRTMRQLRHDGKLPFVLIGRAVRYTLADLEAFIAEHRLWHSSDARVRLSGGTTSPSTVVDFEEVRERRRNERLRASRKLERQ